jgi:hypothetical protein
MPFSTPDRALLLRELLPAVQKNCRISDATHSGFYSLCGLFLRLKDQFLWEKDLPPWTETDKKGLMDWIEARENLWLSHLDLPFENLSSEGRSFGFLDNQRINDLLLPLGLYYGAGLGRGLKPTFFLGEVIEQRKFGGYTVITLDREYASDLLVTPAVRRGKWIILRLSPLRFLLWGKIQEIEHLEREATRAALAYYGWEPDQPPAAQLERLVREEIEAVLLHEIGEGRDRTLPVAPFSPQPPGNLSAQLEGSLGRHPSGRPFAPHRPKPEGRLLGLLCFQFEGNGSADRPGIYRGLLFLPRKPRLGTD